MFMTRKHLSRRTVLKGAGAAIALPFLDAMVPAGRALANIATPPLRLGFVYFAHGAVMDRWTPSRTGTDFDLPQILRPAARHRDSMTIVSNLRNRPAESSDPHGIVERTWLTCVAPGDVGSQGSDWGVSADQFAARHLGQDNPFPSLELTAETRDGGHSFRTPTQRLPMEYNPRTLFYRLFGPGDSPAERAQILSRTSSVLDRVQSETARFRASLGAPDRVVLDDYLDSVREVERRVENMRAQDFTDLDLPAVPVGVPAEMGTHMDLMFDMLALAYQTDLTRVATLRMAGEISMRTYTHIGISEAFHPLSHHGHDAESLDKLTAIQNWHTQVFTRFIDRLAAMPDGDGSVLDHSLILYGSNMSDSDVHNNNPLPSALFGKAGGRVKGGQHLSYPPDTPFANLLLTMLDRANVPIEKIGDSNSLLSEV
jgi:hypothetical protein